MPDTELAAVTTIRLRGGHDDQSTHFIRGPRRTWQPLTRTAAAIIATVGMALPAAVAFGSSQPTNVQKAQAY
ncbi:MAG TPA: hypothetical protein VGH56_11815, partial [Solirubrobacteraceae bacterium]